MQTFSMIIERIKDIISHDIGSQKVFDKDVACALAIDPINFAAMKRRDKIPFLELVTFCAQKKISVNWLLFDQLPESLIDTTEEYATVRYFRDCNASAGGGAQNEDDDEAEILHLPNTFSHLLGGKTDNIDAINVVGDSMEPTLSDGAIIFIDRNKTDYTRGGIFAIASLAGVFVKRLQPMLNGTIEVISDNQEYRPQTLSKGDFTVIGKAVCTFKQLY